MLDNILDAVESAAAGRSAGQPDAGRDDRQAPAAGSIPGLGGVYAGPDGAWVLPGRVS
ncbi:hypothetical protein [Micromonospora sp. KC606]|uniref:hypothetical protein n=1 Tax=Micromonospora sp. KC606 TaxID=2530379 RepID=UPI0014054B44|nr:hypothetical protein [Micromonospora sp. KC606]